MIRHTRPRRLLALVSVVSLTACGLGEAPASTARDSAGIRIVENERSAWSEKQRWRIAAEPTVDIGGADSTPAYLLHRVVNGRRLPDGRIAIPDNGTGEVRIFDSTGRHLSTIGRRGEGPGEFRSPWRIMERPGDSLLVLDIGRGFRFNLFGPDGAFVRSFTTPVATGAEGTEMIGWFADGSSLVRRHEREEPGSLTVEPTRSYVSLFRLGPDGAVLDSLGRFPNQTISSGMYLWGPRAFEAVHDSTVYFGPSDSYEIQRYSTRGTLRGIVRRSRPNTRTTAEDIESFKEEARRRAAQMGGDPRRRAIEEQRMAGARYAPTFPAYSSIHADDPGNLWVQEYSPRIGEGRIWSVFDPTGVYLGDIEMPERFRVFQIGDDFVLGHWRDADDVEHVRMYPLIKPD